MKININNHNTKAGFFYLFGNLFNKAIAFITIPIFTRLMSTSDYGIVNTYMSWVTILSVIVGLSLGNSIRNAHVDYKNDMDGYLSSIFFLSLINFIFTSGIIIFITKMFLKELDIILVILCLIQSFATFIINSINIYYMMNFDYVKRTILLALPNIVISIMSIVMLLYFDEKKYMARIIPYTLVNLAFAVYFLIKSFYRGKVLKNKVYWKYALKLSLPLVFHGLSVNILATSDRTMLTMYRGASETGIYSLVYSFSMIASVVTTSLESVWIPWFTKKMTYGEKDIINKSAKLYVELVTMIMVAILMVGPEIIIIMAPKEYWSGSSLIAPILLASFFIFLYSISVDLEYYYKSTRVIAINTVIAAIINLILNFLFIPKYGAVAAAYTTVVAYLVSFIIHYNTARRLDDELFPFEIYVKPLIVMGLAVLISYIAINHPIIRWSLVIMLLLIYVCLNKNRIMKLLK